MIFILMGANKCEGPSNKYRAPVVADCAILTNWDPTLNTDTATLFCVDERITSETYLVFTEYVLKAFNSHPLKIEVEDYLISNKDLILKTKEFELPISYARGFPAVKPEDRTKLTEWAEKNRMERIKCEYNKQ